MNELNKTGADGVVAISLIVFDRRRRRLLLLLVVMLVA